MTGTDFWSPLMEIVRKNELVWVENLEAPQGHMEPISNDYMMIILCKKGHCHLRYDETQTDFNVGDMAIVMPHHSIQIHEHSKDYTFEVLIVSPLLLSELQQLGGTKYLVYHQQPNVHLTQEQKEHLSYAVRLLDIISRSNHRTPEKRIEAMVQVLNVLFEMIDAYQPQEVDDSQHHTRQEAIFNSFYNMLTMNYREHKEVAWYAAQLYITPKHFAKVVSDVTSIAPSTWIMNYVIMQIKIMLRTHKEMSIAEICFALGFREQPAFTRYFKQATGKTPSEYRAMY